MPPVTKLQIRDAARPLAQYASGQNQKLRTAAAFGQDWPSTPAGSQAISNGLQASGMSRPSATAGLIDGVLLDRGFSLMALIMPADEAEANRVAQARADASAWMRQQIQTPEGVARVVASSTKGYDNVRMDQEMKRLLGAETTEQRRAVFTDPVARAKWNTFISIYYTGARETLQLYDYIAKIGVPDLHAVELVNGVQIDLSTHQMVAVDPSKSPNPALPFLMDPAILSEQERWERLPAKNMYDGIGMAYAPRMLTGFYMHADYTGVPAPAGISTERYESGMADRTARMQRASACTVLVDEVTEQILDNAEQGLTMGQSRFSDAQYFHNVYRTAKDQAERITDDAVLEAIIDGTDTTTLRYTPQERRENMLASREAHVNSVNYVNMNDAQRERVRAQCTPDAIFSVPERLEQMMQQLRANQQAFDLLLAQKNALPENDPQRADLERQLMAQARAQYDLAQRRASLDKRNHPEPSPAPTKADFLERTQAQLRELAVRLPSLTPDSIEYQETLRYSQYLESQVQRVRNGDPDMGRVDTRAVFSPQLNAALRKLRADVEHVYNGGIREIHSVVGDIPTSDLSGHPLLDRRADPREAGRMLTAPPEASPEMLEYIGQVYMHDLVFDTPDSRKRAIGAFLEQTESFDPLTLDLRCLTGMDVGARGTDGLTRSERDFVTLAHLSAMSQNIANLNRLEPGLIDEMYPTSSAKAKKQLVTDFIFSLSDLMSSGVNQNNGYGNLFAPGAPTIEGGMFSCSAMSVELAKQTYKMALDSLNGKEPDTAVTFHIAHDTGSNPISGDYRALVMDKEPLSGGAIQAANSMFSNLIGNAVYNGTSNAYMREHGLDVLDMISLDGVSASVLAAQRYPDLPEYERIDRIHVDIARALVTGSGRVEAAIPLPDKNGNYNLHVTELHADAKVFQKELKERDHGWFHRTFGDWGPFKIKTPADRAEEIWAEDPDKAARQSALLTSVQGKAAAGAQHLADQAQQAAVISAPALDTVLTVEAPHEEAVIGLDEDETTVFDNDEFENDEFFADFDDPSLFSEEGNPLSVPDSKAEAEDKKPEAKEEDKKESPVPAIDDDEMTVFDNDEFENAEFFADFDDPSLFSEEGNPLSIPDSEESKEKPAAVDEKERTLDDSFQAELKTRKRAGSLPAREKPSMLEQDKKPPVSGKGGKG